MRILTLTLKNFRSHQKTILDVERFNFVRGPNASGKSSIQMALEYLFTGRCAMTDAAGRGAESLIRSGAKELEVSATLEGGETICRRRTPRSHIVELNGCRVPVDAAEASLEKRFGSADVLSAVLNAGRFIEMSEAEQKRLLAQVVDAGKGDITEEIGNALRAINEEQPKLTCVADIEAAHRRFYDLRTDVSRSLKVLGQMQKPDIPSDLPSVQEVKKKLEDLQQQKERLVAQKAEADTSWESAQARLIQRKRWTNAPVRGALSVVKSRNAERGEDNGTSATDASGSRSVGGAVCGQRHAAERILPQSGFELEHAGSPSQEAALEEKEEKQPRGWPVGRGGIGHQEVADRARSELRAGRGVGGRTPHRSAARF